jgi:hypothetical protein
MKDYNEQELSAIKDRDEPWLKSLEGVLGTGVGMDLRRGGRTSLKVFVSRVFPETRTAIEQRYGDNVPVAIEAIGGVQKAT